MINFSSFFFPKGNTVVFQCDWKYSSLKIFFKIKEINYFSWAICQTNRIEINKGNKQKNGFAAIITRLPILWEKILNMRKNFFFEYFSTTLEGLMNEIIFALNSAEVRFTHWDNWIIDASMNVLNRRRVSCVRISSKSGRIFDNKLDNWTENEKEIFGRMTIVTHITVLLCIS